MTASADRQHSRRPVLDALSPAQRAVAEALGERWRAAGEELHLVGGIVRDALLDRPAPADLDFTTSAEPDETQRLAKEAGAASIYLVGERFGTVGAVFEPDGAPPIPVEITTYRAERYPDETRFPTVRFGVGLVDDLARRDFTANALAADALTGDIVDPFDGQADIARGILRAVGDPDARFQEDPLRLLRAARFVSQLGFRIEPETEATMARHAPSLARISRERVYAELNKLLTGPYVDHALEMLRRTGLVQYVMPELSPLAAEAETPARARGNREKDLWDHTLRVVRRAPARPVVRWAALLHDAAKPLTRGVGPDGEVHFFGHERQGADLATRLLRRLKADRHTQEAVARLVALHGRPAAYDASWTDSAVRRLALEAGETWEDLLDVAAADVTSAREHKQRLAAQRVTDLRAHFDRLQAEADLARLQSPLDGNQLMDLFDRGPGVWIKGVKEHLRELVIDGELAPDDTERAAEIAAAWLADHPEG